MFITLYALVSYILPGRRTIVSFNACNTRFVERIPIILFYAALIKLFINEIVILCSYSKRFF